MLKVNFPTSPGVLLRDVSKMDRRLYKQPRREIKTMKMNSFTRAYVRMYIRTPMIRTCLHCLHALRFVLHTYMDKCSREFRTRAIVVQT